MITRTPASHGSLVAIYVGLVLLVTTFQSARAATLADAQADALKIVVIAGEDAVNIIQQKTAVAPIVEVRDRNDQPVSGAVVNFAIRSGRATFGSARTLSVTTDVAGRAVASGLTPTGSGALQISASAAFQGQTTAAVTIAQTNVLTAAQAAAIGSAGSAGGAGGAGGAAGTASAGGGGGLSGLTIGAIAGGVGAGAVGAAFAFRDPAGSSSTPYAGTYAGQLLMSFTTLGPSTTATCVHTKNIEGTLTMTMQQLTDGTVTGAAATTTTQTVVATSAGCNPQNIVIGSRTTESWSLPVTGTAQSVQFRGEHPYVGTPFTGGSVDGLRVLSFSGSLAGGVLSGAMSLVDTARGTTQGLPLVWDGSTTLAITLR